MKPVSEILKLRPGTLHTVRPDDSVFDALQQLAEHEVGALVVMDGQRMVGVVSERDYTRKVALQGRSSKETKVSEIMTSNVFVDIAGTVLGERRPLRVPPVCPRILTRI